MPVIALKAGDFGTGVTVTIGEEEMYLPNPAAPGTVVPIPLNAITDVETVSEDRSDQAAEAVRLGLRGAAFLGPVGLAAGVLAVRKVKDITFLVRLKDGRQFVATGGAGIYADLRGARITGNLSGGIGEDRAADELIAKYLDEHREPAEAPPRPVGQKGEPPKPAPAAPVFGRRRT